MSTTTLDIDEYCEEMARSTWEASRRISTLPGKTRNDALSRFADLLRDEGEAVLQANALDLEAAPGLGLSTALIDRLRLDRKRLETMARAVEEIVALPDPVGRIIDSTIRPNGLEVQKVRVPLGVVFFIYESRPNVTADAAALCLKSGNAVILRGGKEARHSNVAIATLFRRALVDEGIPEAAVSMVEIIERAAIDAFLKLDQHIDVAIPRGGEALIRRVVGAATMPVLKHYKGNCHVYVDAAADPEMAVAIVENAKCQRPGVCNAAETLLVHRSVAAELLPAIADRLFERGVELRGCPATRAVVAKCRPADEEDFDTEFLDLILAVRVVDDLEAALEHVARYGSGHTETIVTNDLRAARRFTAAVDSSAVLVNASTRFNDGGEFGLGAEIGISTDKFHARGPCGLNELTTYKYVAYGNGHLR